MYPATQSSPSNVGTPGSGCGSSAQVVAMEVTVEDTCGSWSGQHLLRVASGGGLGMSHCPAMGLSHRAGSPAPPPPAAPTKDLLSRAPHPLPAPRLSLVLVVGIGTSGLPPGAWPGSGCLPHVWKVTMQGLAFPERGLPGPESLPGQQKIIFSGPTHAHSSLIESSCLMSEEKAGAGGISLPSGPH